MFQRDPSNMLLRRLLQLDRPVPSHTPETFNAEVERNYRWNFAVNLLDGASFSFGSSFLSAATIVPLFISKLTDSHYAIGLAATIAQGAWFLPQLLTANFVERLPRKKPVVVNLGLFLERLPMAFIVLAAILAWRWPLLALIVFLLAYAWHNLGAGVVATAWQDLISCCFPVQRRGRFLGSTLFLGSATGAVAAIFSAWVLDHLAFPANFLCAFLLAALFTGAISWFFLALTREPVRPQTSPPNTHEQHIAELIRILRHDLNYRRFLIARLTLALGAMGSGFLAVAAVQRWNLPDSVVGIYTAVFLAGQTIGNLVFGHLADRTGHKISIEIAALMAAASFATAWVAPSPAWFHLAFALAGGSMGAITVSGLLVVLEFCSPERIPTYTGLTNTAIGLISVAAPLVGAALARRSYAWLFATSAAISLVAFLLLRCYVREPRHIPPPPMTALSKP